MRLRVHHVGTIAVLAVSGKVMQQDVDVLRDAIARQFNRPQPQIVLDMAELTHLDSAALGILVASQIRARNEGATLKLANPGKKLIDMLALTRLANVFDIYGSLPEAIASFERPA